MIEVGPFAIMGDWDTSLEPPGRKVIRLVPQQLEFAFGNAWKPSSLAFLRNMDTLVVPGNTVIDIGAGTGLLAIAALRLGARKVTAVEPSDTGIRYARLNLAANQLEDKVELIQGWYGVNSYTLQPASPLSLPRANTVLCNIDTFEVLEAVLAAHLAPKVAMMPDTREFAQFQALALATGYQIVHNELVVTYTDSYNYVIVEEYEHND